MKIYIRLILALILFIFINTSKAQYIADVQFWGVEEGLPHRDVSNVNQDSLGFIWIGTNIIGLLRYSGHQFEQLTMASHGLHSNKNHLVLEDANGWFWLLGDGGFGIKPHKVSVFNPYTFDTKTIQEYLGGAFPEEKLNKIRWLTQHPDGTIFIDIWQNDPLSFHPSGGLKTQNVDLQKYWECDYHILSTKNIEKKRESNPIYTKVLARLEENETPFRWELGEDIIKDPSNEY